MCDDICRTCLSSDDLEPIFADTNSINQRSKDIFRVTGVKIKPNDKFPQHLCKQCSEIISNSLKLRLKSKESDQILKKKYNVEKERINEKRKQERIDIEFNEVVVNEICEVEINECNENETNELGRHEKNEMEANEKNGLGINENKTENGAVKRDSNLSNTNAKDKTDSTKNNVKTNKVEKVYIRKRMPKEVKQKYLALAIQTTKGGPVRCNLCEKELKDRHSFFQHAKTHFEAEHTCEFCSKKFVNKFSMRNHQQRKHGAQRKHACPKCPYRAVDASQLVNHERSVHSGLRPYSCPVCGDKFMLQTHVKQHLRKHSATYTVQCDKCPAMFKSGSDLAGHRNKVHEYLYTFTCYLCSNKYRSPSSVKKHLLRVHKIPKDQQLTIPFTKVKRDEKVEEHQKPTII